MHGIEPLSFTVDVTTPGWHDLVVYRSDAAILFDRIIIETRAGAAGDGLVGPPESPNNIAAPQRATVAPRPRTMPELRRLPAIRTSVDETSTVQGVRDAEAAKSDNETAASVAVTDGQVRITGHRAGTAEISITVGGQAWVASVTVGRAAGAPVGAYLERDGSAVLDAADALEKSASATAIDGNNGTHGWALARNGLQVVPPADAGAKAQWLATSAAQAEALFKAGPTEKVNGSSAAGAPPRLDFTVAIQTRGTYYLFVNTSNPNADADSYHVVVDGQWRYQSGKSGPETGFETWYGSTSVAGAALTLEPGEHTISLAPREAGLVLNQIALTTDDTPGLTGFQAPSGRRASAS
ncbi:hypothetical protein GCM10022419_096860 [Nonomuraea rosea]|uniref:BIG2 domain-containing protein n=2 Tax=Nonomuraea rosea TaxID=638574 RepID=A0ABP6Z4V4_9ACTN